MENQLLQQQPDNTQESKYYLSKENVHDSQANEESESNLKPLNMFQEDEDQEEEEENNYDDDDLQIIQRSQNSFNDRLSDFDLDAKEHFASIYKDSDLNDSKEDYNDRDLDNNSYLNSVLHISKVKQSSEFNINQSNIMKEEDSFLKNVIRESEELQKELRQLDMYYWNQNQLKNQQENLNQLNYNQQQTQGINNFISSQNGDSNEQQYGNEIQPQNNVNDKQKKGLKKNDSKNQLISVNKETKQVFKDTNKKQTIKAQTTTKKEQKATSFSENKQKNNNQLDHRIIQTEPFQVSERYSQKRKKSQHSQQDNKQIKSRNTSTSQPRSQSKGKEVRSKNKCNLKEDTQTTSEKSKKNKKLVPKSKESSASNKKQNEEIIQIKSNKQSYGEQSDQKQQLSMNPLLMISDFDDNLKNSYSEQMGINMLQQFMIKNDINSSSYVPNILNNNNYIQEIQNQNNNQDYQNVSNISTNHQFFHNEYLQDQVPNLENESELFDQEEENRYENDSEDHNCSSYSQFSHVYDSEEENKYSTHQNSNYDIYQQQQNKLNQQSDFNSTGDFQKQQIVQKQNNLQNNNLYQVSYQDNTRLNNYFTEEEAQRGYDYKIQKQTNQTQFTFNSTNGDCSKNDANTQTIYNTSNNTPSNRETFQLNKMLGSSSSARLRNADSNSLWDLSQDNESVIKDNQMKIDELKLSQKVAEKKVSKKNKSNKTQNTKTKVNKSPKKKIEAKKKVSGSYHSIKEVKSNITTQRKGKETINSKTSLNNIQSDKNCETEANLYSNTSNEQNIIHQLEKQLQEKDQLIDLLKKQNSSLKQKLLNTQKQKRDQTHSSASNYSQQHQQNGMIEQLSIAKRLQETNKILIDRIKELDLKRQQQTATIEHKNEQFKILKQKYSELKKEFRCKIKKNNDLKKENELIKQIKSEITPQNIDYTQLVQALAQISQHSDFKDQFVNREREDMSRGTFYTQRSSALGDYGDNKINQLHATHKIKQDQQVKKKDVKNNIINEENYYNQSIQNIQQQNKSVNTNNQSDISQKKKNAALNSKKNSTQTIKTLKSEKLKQNK
ncbi:hypothetical protein TTHERM_00726060 (macronuclear) [Tetrahymena thermophila SB210]|uniref:Uncharacterized protein n=1 Tax=Tetrahymena thermophila (strain SB210) TaxID=312017 RepID=Q24GI4_TETTS|nr:hypothetical protein TTHERM_00726060 [Tetrahymena thermophila SB210]EAS06887.1 hypothetical protein TTHERM_00726060 [Tetrahymena thermophila SB210]|eukprot:XP_001027129.1 hypothetical protein TTHERM_00726060 [Tetrahymena thermophila SB210]